ncbi:MAG: DNA alkylation repair protein [Candidatus Hodarchaeales archaeon]
MIAEEVQNAKAILRENADPENLAKFLKFVPGAQNALVVRTAILDDIVRSIWMKQRKQGISHIIETCQALWTPASYYEERKVAIRLLEKVVKRDSQSVMDLTNAWKQDIHTWDLCDQLGMRCSGNCLAIDFERYLPDIRSWHTKSELWIRRLALVSLVKLRRISLTDKQLDSIFEIFHGMWDDDRHYIRKGLTWSLRELSRSNSLPIKQFLELQIKKNILGKKMGIQFLRDSIKKLDPQDQKQLIALYHQQTQL